jgi:hypothetical protein
MVNSEALQNKWDKDWRVWKTTSEVAKFLFEFWIYPEFWKRVELVLQAEDPRDALHPDVQEAIIAWNKKIYWVQDKKWEIYAAADDYISKVA